MASVQPPTTSRTLRKRIGIAILPIGMLVFLLGAAPQWFGLDRSPVVGFVQIGVFTIGLGLISAGGYMTMEGLWHDRPKLIVTELGARFIGTGYVIALASGMADVFGLGTRPLPSVPFFGYWQGRGVLIGEIVIIIGLVMMSPFWGRRAENKKPQ
ncbi:MAG: hypothetical protein M1347_04775 [Chloroflexi bacterium]|nr:hypothetical protein [Chloroflexota bacterium]